MSHDLSTVTLAILAGGASRRMGRPKSLLTIGGQPILAYLLDRFAWPGPTMLVTAPGRERPPGHERFDTEAVDAVADQGPLRGVLTTLLNIKTPAAVITTIDMPAQTVVQLAFALSHLLHDPSRVGVMMERMRDHNLATEPFPFACRATAVGVIEQRLRNGMGAMHALTRVPGFAAMPAPIDWAELVWTNLNRPEEFDAFVSSLERV